MVEGFTSSCPSDLKFLLPFLQKSEEMIQAGHPVVAYYCKFYAVSLALRSGPNKYKRTPEIDAFLANLFDHLESEKQNLSTYSTIKDLEQGAIYVREFAYRVFLLAEKQEASNETLKKAVQSYLASLNFLQVYRGVFLEDPAALQLTDEERQDELNQVDEKSKYAKWRIIEIRKQLMLNSASPPTQQSSAIKSPINTNPTFPPTMSSIIQQSPQPFQSTTTTTTSPTISISTLSPAAAGVVTSIPFQTSSNSSSPTLLYDPKVLSECEKQARHAISALNFDDIETAAHNLQTALDILKPLLNKKN